MPVTSYDPVYERRANPDHAALFAYTQGQEDALFAGLSSEDRLQVEQIFLRNLANGRAQKVMGRAWSQRNHVEDGVSSIFVGFSISDYQQPECEHRECKHRECEQQECEQWRLHYLQRVIQVYQQEHLRLRALSQGDNDAW